MKRVEIKLTNAQMAYLENFKHSEKRSAREYDQANVLLLLNKGKKDKEIEDFFGVDRITKPLFLRFLFFLIMWGYISTNNLSFAQSNNGINVKNYGAKGDGKSDDYPAIIRALNTIQFSNYGGTLYFPRGVYMISQPIMLNNNPVLIKGESYTSAIIKAAKPMEAVFLFQDAQENNRSEFKNIDIEGNEMANYGIESKKIAHALFDRIRISGTLEAALNIGYGWCNDIIESEFSYNYGNGIMLNTGGNNALNILNNKIFANKGIGIFLSASGLEITIMGNTLEQNAQAAIYALGAITGLSISNNYFESNGKDGINFTGPSENIKANILLNGAGTVNASNQFVPAFPNTGITIRNNFFSNTYTDEAINLITGKNCSVSNNTFNIGYGKPMVLIRSHADTSHIHLFYKNNEGFKQLLDVGH